MNCSGLTRKSEINRIRLYLILRISRELKIKTITATELARNLSRVLDRLAARGEAIIVERNHRQVARIIPEHTYQTALEAMGDLYRTLPDEAAVGWLVDGRTQPAQDGTVASVRNPWAT